MIVKINQILIIMIQLPLQKSSISAFRCYLKCLTRVNLIKKPKNNLKNFNDHILKFVFKELDFYFYKEVLKINFS